jgi:hypothetical protein
MSERAKITPSHLARQAIVYLRQSSAAQVEHNRESTDQQYALADKARELGWPAERVVVIDEDLGLSGSGAAARSGFARLIAEVALARGLSRDWGSCRDGCWWVRVVGGLEALPEADAERAVVDGAADLEQPVGTTP